MSPSLTQTSPTVLAHTSTQQQSPEQFGTPDQAKVHAQHAQTARSVPAQVAARPPGKLSTGGQKAAKVPPKGTDLHCWAKFMPSITASPGEFGFDWMDWARVVPQTNFDWQELLGVFSDVRVTAVMDVAISNFEYCYDKVKKQYVNVEKDAYLKQRLQDEYERLYVYGEDYFAAWLSMWPKSTVKLRLSIEKLNEASANGDYLTFAKHAHYKVTVNGQVNEAIRIPLQGENQDIELRIECVKACTDTYVLVLDEKGAVAGKLNIVSNIKKYHLPVRVVHLVKDGPGSIARLAALRMKFTDLYLETYLNLMAFNQAHIQIDFERTNQHYEIVFEEARWAGKYYDHKKHSLMDYGMERLFIDKILDVYEKKYEKKTNRTFRGIILFVSDLPHEAFSGVSRVQPLSFRGAAVFADVISDKTAYAHEISHALGLYHSFFDPEDNSNLISLNYSIERRKIAIKKEKKERSLLLTKIKYIREDIVTCNKIINNKGLYLYNIEAKKIDDELKRLNELLQKAITELKENKERLKNINNELVEYNGKLQTYVTNPYKFKIATTDNIMDYKQNARKTHFHWQWRIMQREILKYYGN